MKDLLSDSIGTLAVYEMVCSHLSIPDRDLDNSVKQLDLLIREKELIYHVLKTKGDNLMLRERLAIVERNTETIINRFPLMSNILESEFSCNFRQLYEVTLMNLKNRLVALQKKRILEGKEERNAIIDRIRYMENKFGENSLQASDEREKLLRFDDVKLKERATAFRDFLDVNNEKATRVFCKLSKEGGLCDNQDVIRNANGEVFENGKDRNEYIRMYYEGVYKKRLDSLLTI